MMKFKIALLFLGLAFLVSCQNENANEQEGTTEVERTEAASNEAQLSTSADAANNPPAQEPAPQNDGPTTTREFEKDLHDFGTIADGDKVTHSFVFTNTGDKPLVLSNARGSCGCTVPEWPREPIMPGETGELTVEYDSRNKGSVDGKTDTKFVTVTANTVPNTHRLTVRAHVVKEAG